VASQLDEWYLANKLSVNIDKTCYSVFCSNRTCDNANNVVKCNDNVPAKVHSCKYLGVMIDEQLSWKTHIDYVYSKLLKFTGIFYKLRSKLCPMFLERYIMHLYIHC